MTVYVGICKLQLPETYRKENPKLHFIVGEMVAFWSCVVYDFDFFLLKFLKYCS